MYPARKNTNINKHKFFHPGTAKNQAKLWTSEEKEREAVQEATVKRKQIDAERREMTKIQQLDPENLGAYQLKWMYDTKKGKDDDVELENQPKRSNKIGSQQAAEIVERGKAVQREYAQVVQKRMQETESAAKRKEDPMASAMAQMKKSRKKCV